jgi:hypothetical protein
VPLVRWIEWDTGARQRWIDSTGNFFGITRLQDIVAVPYEPDVYHSKLQVGTQAVPDSLPEEQKMGKYALGAAQAYSSMKTFRQCRTSQFEMEVAADDLFEATAHLIQLQAAWTGQSQAAAEKLLEFVSTSDARHLRPLQMLWTAMQRCSEPIGLQRLTELFTWMLLGPWEEVTSSGNPSNRYFQVLQLAASSPDDAVFITAMPAAKRFDRLDVLTHSLPWRSSLTSAAASADRRKAMYSSASQTLRGAYFDALFAVGTAWHEDQHSVKRTFLTDPESFVDPLRYISEDLFPNPYLESRFGSMMAHERDEPLASDEVRAITIDPERKKVISYIGKLGSKKTPAGLDEVVAARQLTHMVDFVFADEPVLDAYEYWLRSQAERIIGKRLVSVY